MFLIFYLINFVLSSQWIDRVENLKGLPYIHLMYAEKEFPHIQSEQMAKFPFILITNNQSSI